MRLTRLGREHWTSLLRLRYLSLLVFAVLVIYFLTSCNSPNGFLGLQSSKSSSDAALGFVPDPVTVQGLHGTHTPSTAEGAVTAAEADGTASDQSPQFHVVISHYAEDPFFINRWLTTLKAIPTIAALDVRVFIYTKSANPDLSAIKSVSGADQVLQLPNIGREGSTYLHHILAHYDNLPAYTMFTQAYLKKAQRIGTGPWAGSLEEWLAARLEQHFDTAKRRVGFMSLDRKHDLCHCGHCSDMARVERDAFYPLWPQMYALIEGKACSRQQTDVVSFNGHFIVSAARIKRRPRGVYEYLKHLVDAPQEHWVHAEPEPKWFGQLKGPSKPSEPKFGHTLERLWHVLFDCGDPSKVVDCEVDMSKTEGPGGCTCLDQ